MHARNAIITDDTQQAPYLLLSVMMTFLACTASAFSLSDREKALAVHARNAIMTDDTQQAPSLYLIVGDRLLLCMPETETSS